MTPHLPHRRRSALACRDEPTVPVTVVGAVPWWAFTAAAAGLFLLGAGIAVAAGDSASWVLDLPWL